MGARHKLDNKSADMSAVHLPQIKGRIQRGVGGGGTCPPQTFMGNCPPQTIKKKKKRRHKKEKRYNR